MSVDEGPQPLAAFPLVNVSVLLLEHNTLIAIDSRDALLDAGARAVEALASVGTAVTLVQSGVIDGAVVDLGSDMTFTLAGRPDPVHFHLKLSP